MHLVNSSQLSLPLHQVSSSRIRFLRQIRAARMSLNNKRTKSDTLSGSRLGNSLWASAQISEALVSSSDLNSLELLKIQSLILQVVLQEPFESSTSSNFSNWLFSFFLSIFIMMKTLKMYRNLIKTVFTSSRVCTKSRLLLLTTSIFYLMRRLARTSFISSSWVPCNTWMDWAFFNKLWYSSVLYSKMYFFSNIFFSISSFYCRICLNSLTMILSQLSTLSQKFFQNSYTTLAHYLQAGTKSVLMLLVPSFVHYYCFISSQLLSLEASKSNTFSTDYRNFLNYLGGFIFFLRTLSIFCFSYSSW